MAVPVLKELFAAVPRLVAAGSSAARSDTRLRQSLPALRSLADSVPALAPLAEAMERLQRVPADQAARAFLDVLLRVRQVRSAMLSSGVSGELLPLPSSGPWRTTVPAEMVCAAAQALAAKGSGRDAALMPLADRSDSGDLRLLEGLLRQLDESYASLADFTAARLLPQFGKPILAELRAGYAPRGKMASGRRLLAIAHIDAREGRKLALEAMQQGSPAVKAMALSALTVADREEARRAAIEILSGKAKAALKRLAVETLEQIQARDAEAAAALVRALADGDFYTSHKAQSVLGKVGRSAVPALIELLQGSDAEIRRKAIWALNRIGKDAAEAVPVLVAALDDATPLYGVPIPRCAMATLAAIGPAARAAVKPLSRFLESSDLHLRFGAAKALLRITGQTRRYLPLLIASLSAPDIHLRRDAALALEEIGPDAKAAVPALMVALKDRKGGTRPFAATALGRIGERVEEVVPLLMEMLNEPESYNRYNAVRALGFFGPKARAALPVLREASGDRLGYIREAVSKAVAAIEGGGSFD